MAGLFGYSVCSAVASAGLVAGDGVIWHQVGIGPMDRHDVRADHDCAIHLGQLP